VSATPPPPPLRWRRLRRLRLWRLRRLKVAYNRLPESYQEYTDVFGVAGAATGAGGGATTSSFGGGHRPAIRWDPPAPPNEGQDAVLAAGLGAAVASVSVVPKTERQRSPSMSRLRFGGARADGGAGAGAESRKPMSYQESTGLVGGVQSGGGLHNSRGGGFGHRPAIRWLPAEPPFIAEPLAFGDGFGFAGLLSLVVK